MKRLSLYIAIFSTLLFMGCDSEEPEKPEPTPDVVAEMTVEINHTADNAELEFNSEYVLPSNEKVVFRRLAYILSNFHLVKSDDTKIELSDQYGFIDARLNKTSFTLNNVPTGDYKAIGFSIGLDSNINHGNPNVYGVNHPLAPINNSLHWSWQGGYIFTAIEGKTMADDESFIFHLAGAQNRLDVVLPIDFTKKEAALTANLQYNLMEIFKNPEVYSISVDGASTHTVDSPVTMKLLGNMSDIFSMISVNE